LIARLPLIRIPVKHSYSTSELQGLLNPYLSSGRQYVPSVQAAAVNAQQNCPKCGSDMLLRTAKSGANQGARLEDLVPVTAVPPRPVRLW
jgi:predicted RNA-binding Zn-ribbon protein involved in translation (DUF1610 family)